MNNKQDLYNYVTLKVHANCKDIISINSEIDVYKTLVFNNTSFRILGGGSNVLPVDCSNDIILLNNIKGLEIVDEDSSQVLVSVGAGEYWTEFVRWSLSHNLGGIENLTLIPGKVGAAPIQNIGAYGVEQKRCFHSLRAIDLKNGTSKMFFKEDCNFGYRDSIFKQEYKNKYIITRVNYILFKESHELVLSYGKVQEKLEEKNILSPSIRDVAQIVNQLRISKLPDPNQIPNAGSFFKNPIVSKEKLKELQKKYQPVPNYSINETFFKLPAAWLIEQSNLKGHTYLDAGTYDKHSLIIVNHGRATSQDILHLANYIESTVKQKFNILLEKEVNIWQ